MDEFDSTRSGETIEVPDQLRTLFNRPDDVRVLVLPSYVPRLKSMAVHFGAGSRTVPHVHHDGQHLVYVDGIWMVGDDSGVHIVHAGDVVSGPPGARRWHGAVPGQAAAHVAFDQPGDFDHEVERRDWDTIYPDDLGA
ncbi:hypothetical protein [Terrabacter sp. RAF57]|uniref:hypothetical protein n=1 Tax=Terrabacter sp. RAF57 TaxID=3233063 RepID=UPI003F999867